MGHGIGPQNLGAQGMSSKSKPCGSPLDATAAQNAAFGPGSELADKDPQRAKEILDGINEADSGANYGTPLNSQMPGLGVGGGGMIGGISSLATAFGGATARKRELIARRRGGGNTMVNSEPGQAAFAANAASPGGGSAGMQADLEGLQTKLADLKSQIDNLANTV